jgi:ATP-binding cassette subfamily B protein
MKILFTYLKPYKWLVALTLFLAAINTGFSLLDPIIFGKLITLATEHQELSSPGSSFSWHDFLFVKKNSRYKSRTHSRVRSGVVVAWLHHRCHDQQDC